MTYHILAETEIIKTQLALVIINNFNNDCNALFQCIQILSFCCLKMLHKVSLTRC